MQEKMVPKHELSKSIPLHAQELNCRIDVCELEDHVGEEGLRTGYQSLGLQKKLLLQVFLVTY